MTQHHSEDPRNGMQAGSAIAAAVLQQAETWSRTQCEFVSGIEAICSRWMQWQREAIDAAGRSLVAISESRDLGSVFQIQHEWFTEAARRSASNWSALAKDATELPWRVARVDPTREHSASAPGSTGQPQPTEQFRRQAAE
jgi:phasin protein